MDIAAIRQAVADALSVITTPGGSPIQTSPYILPNPSPPTAWCFPHEADFHQAMNNGLSVLHLLVQAMATTTGADQAAQAFLDELIRPDGTQSVKVALEADITLGGVCQYLIVNNCSGYKMYPVQAGVHRLGAEWEVDVYV